MNAQHTPNWFIDQYGHVYAMRPPVDGVSTSECLVDSRYSKATVQEKLLIAAAPELLNACRAARSAIVLGNGREIDWDAIADELEAAIAKATGAQ